MLALPKKLFQGHESEGINSLAFVMDSGPITGGFGSPSNRPWLSKIQAACLGYVSGTELTNGRLQSLTFHWKQACVGGENTSIIHIICFFFIYLCSRLYIFFQFGHSTNSNAIVTNIDVLTLILIA